ncbi:hypothetical protein [Mesomycoplasma ovipneumoniae]|uniref:hypothetical protein n=2 Tax=Mesomycoplasma ovipneumoniae TaxID=29562 RepID=UPI003080806E
MSDIIDLEIKNLWSGEKERLFQQLAGKPNKFDEVPKLGKKYPKRVQLNKNYKTFEKYAGNVSNLSEEQKKEKLEEYQKWLDFNKYNKYKFNPEFLSGATQYYDELDQVLGAYFKDYPDEFITFQSDFKHSVYNKTLKQHDFKDFDYKDVIEDLTEEEKDKIIGVINSLVHNLARPGEDVSLWHINPEDKKEMEAYKKLPADKKSEYKIESYYPELEENLDKYLKNEYFLDRYDFKHEYYKELKFFKNADQLINFALKQTVSTNVLLHDFNEILNPKHKVNQWIVTNHELEQVQKDGLEQSQKFEKPKLKM